MGFVVKDRRDSVVSDADKEEDAGIVVETDAEAKAPLWFRRATFRNVVRRDNWLIIASLINYKLCSNECNALLLTGGQEAVREVGW